MLILGFLLGSVLVISLNFTYLKNRYFIYWYRELTGKNKDFKVNDKLIDLGSGWYISEPVYNRFYREGKVNLLLNGDYKGKVNLCNEVKIGEEQIEYFSQVLEGEKHQSISDNNKYINYPDKTYRISEINFHEIERPAVGFVPAGFYDELIQAPFEIDLKRLRRIRETKPIYKQVKKTELELFTEIYEFINEYETKERLC